MNNPPEHIDLLLASASPARAATLRAAGIEPLIWASNVDEDQVLSDLHADYDTQNLKVTPAMEVAALAGAKARATRDSPTGRKYATSRRILIIGCDTMLEFRGKMLGKPLRPEVAFARIKDLQGNDAILWTGHHLILLETGIPTSGHAPVWKVIGESTASASTIVHFDEISDAEIQAYVATGEPLNVAGAFTIDGLGGAFLRGVTGDPHSVVGISLPLVRQMAKKLGVFWPSLWTAPLSN